LADRVNTVRITCTQCGAVASRYVSGGKPAQYCGNACKVAAHKAKDAVRRATYRAREAERKRTADKARVRVVVWMNLPAPIAKPPKVRLCPDCASVLSKRQIRCAPCRDVQAKHINRNSPARRADKARRKAMGRGRAVGAERFDPLEVLARDGWRCHICGISTPKRLRGTYHDQAPELDHITPLALGGQHTRQNTACACRKCNIAKGSRPLGQLRLVA
jgi:5-methylcytosine-specific restriction endonuclease McrA